MCSSDLAEFLTTKGQSPLWHEAVVAYVNERKFRLIDTTNNWTRTSSFRHDVEMLRREFNITVQAFSKDRGSSTCSPIKSTSRVDKLGRHRTTHDFGVSPNTFFVVTDTRVGSFERAKYHWRKAQPQTKNRGSHNVYVLSPADRSREIGRAHV